MKTLILTFIIGFSFFNNFSNFEKKETTNLDFECRITAKENVIRMGTVPEITVEIINRSSKEVHFIKYLDGSGLKRRMPYSYFKIEKPRKDPSPGPGICAFMNPIKPEDFVEVKPEESFFPFGKNSTYSGFEMQRLDNFRNSGTYKIQFHYSTNSELFDDFSGTNYNDKIDKKKNSRIT